MGNKIRKFTLEGFILTDERFEDVPEKIKVALAAEDLHFIGKLSRSKKSESLLSRLFFTMVLVATASYFMTLYGQTRSTLAGIVAIVLAFTLGYVQRGAANG